MVTAQTLNPVDAIWLNTECPENLLVIEALVLLEGPVDRVRLERVLQRRVVERFPVFGQRLVVSGVWGGLGRWTDVSSFEVSDHVREVVVAAPGDEAALQAYVGGFLSVPLRRDRPMWEVHLVRGLATGSAMYVRLHHSLADGIALTQVLLSLTDPDPDPDADPDADSDADSDPDADADEGCGEGADPSGESVSASGGVGGVLGLLGRVVAVGASLLGPARLFSTLAVVGQAGRVAARLLVAVNPTTAMSAVSGRAGRDKVVVWSTPIPLTQVKRLAGASGSTVNDVLVAALAGALRRYQTYHGGRAVDVRTMIPVNLRPLDMPLPARLGNRFAVVLLTLPSGLATPAARLGETKRRMDAIKASPEALVTFGLLHAIGLTGHRLSPVLARFFARKADAVTTNVPGPREHRYLAGTRVAGLLGWVPSSTNQTLGTCIFTYAGTVRVGFKVDALAIPDPGRILAGFHAELESLYLLAPAEPGPRDVGADVAHPVALR